MKHRIILLALTGIIFAFCSNNIKKNPVTIGRKSNINCIIVSDKADGTEKFSGNELSAYIEKITGISLPVKKSSEVENNVKAIRLVKGNRTEIIWDGFGIDVDNNGIRIEANMSRGLLYGVYTLLEEAGCSFFYPGYQEEVVPRVNNILFRQRSEIINPLIEHRGLSPYGLQGSSVEAGRNLIDWMAKNKMNFILVSEDRPSDCTGSAHSSLWKEVTGQLLPELQKRDFVIDMSEHCTRIFFPRSLYQQHPEWYALNHGERKLGNPPYSGQMCYSNPDAVEFYASAVADYAARHNEFRLIGTWPLDGGEYCECEKCKDNQTVFRACKRVADKVKAVRPDMVVEYLAYKPQTWYAPENENIPCNMSVLWCPDNGKMEDLARKWIQKSQNSGGVYQFEYYMGDNYRSRTNVLLRPVFSSGLVKHAKEMGFRGVISLFLSIESWWRSSFNNWFFARMCWNPDFDVNDGMNEYCKKYYGRFAADINNIFSTIFTELHPESYLVQGIESYYIHNEEIKLISEKLLSQIDKILAENDDPVLKKRIIRLRTYVEFFRLFTDAFTRKKPADLETLIKYSSDHPEQYMVLMYPEYIRWRNENTFGYGR